MCSSHWSLCISIGSGHGGGRVPDQDDTDNKPTGSGQGGGRLLQMVGWPKRWPNDDTDIIHSAGSGHGGGRGNARTNGGGRVDVTKSYSAMAIASLFNEETVWGLRQLKMKRQFRCIDCQGTSNESWCDEGTELELEVRYVAWDRSSSAAIQGTSSSTVDTTAGPTVNDATCLVDGSP